jgi:hypothetical protein
LRYLHTFNNFKLLNEAVSIDPIETSDYFNQVVIPLPFSEEIKTDKEDFLKKLAFVAKDLGIKPEWLIILVKHCSDFSPSSVDSNGGTMGIINWTLRSVQNFINPLNGDMLSSADLRAMTAVEQLDVVHAYFRIWFKVLNIKEINHPGEFFALTFYPNLINLPDNWIFPRILIKANPGLFERFPDVGSNTKASYYSYCESLIEEIETGDYKIPEDESGMLGRTVAATSQYVGGEEYDKEITNLAKIILDPEILKQIPPENI